MAGPIYISAADFIKQKPFDLFVPAFYHPHLPTDIRNPGKFVRERPTPFKKVAVRGQRVRPFDHVIDPNQMQKAAFSIEVMLDMYQKKIEFEIANEDDIVEIFEGLDRYLLSLKPEVLSGDQVSVDYARLVVRWRGELYKHYYRYMKTHPAALEKLYPNNNPTQNLLHLMTLTSGLREGKAELDPLRAKAQPPYDIEQSQPKDKVANDITEVDPFLGMDSPSVDDGKGFDIDSFIGRG